MDGLLYKMAHADTLLATSLSYGPEALTPLLSFASSRTLGNTPINDAEAQSPLGRIIRRFDIRAGDKGEIVSTVHTKAFGHLSSGPPSLGASTGFDTLLPSLFQSTLKGLGVELVAAMNQMKQRFELVQ